jgi:hypothetical protein
VQITRNAYFQADLEIEIDFGALFVFAFGICVPAVGDLSVLLTFIDKVQSKLQFKLFSLI